MGKATLASIELSDTKRVRYNTNKKTPTHDSAVQGENCQYQSKKCCNTLTSSKIGPNGENMPHHGRKAPAYL